MAVVEIVEVKAQPIAAVRRRVTLATIASAIRNSGVWDWMKTNGVKSGGHNIVIYHDAGGPDLLAEIGADVPESFQGDDIVVSAATPAGRAVTARHHGDYTTMGATHRAIRDFIATRELPYAHINWEVYGHWTPEPADMTADICYLLAPEEASRQGRKENV